MNSAVDSPTEGSDPSGHGLHSHPHEHHWFKEPTEPAPKKYIVGLLVFGTFTFFTALYLPAIVGIGLKIQDLVHQGMIEANGATRAAAIMGGWGAVFAATSNVVFGRVSDRTTSRWGRRRIWIVLGGIILAIALVIMALAPSLVVATIGWCLAQFGANMALAPMVATIADQVPRFQRGKITSWRGIAENFGVLASTVVAQAFDGRLFLMFFLPSLVMVIGLIIFAIILPDKVMPVKPPRMNFAEAVQTFWVSPIKYPDYALAWWSRFFIMFASFGFTLFRFFYLLNHVKVPEHDIPGVVSVSVLIFTACLMVCSFGAGWLSDKLGRRKVFVWSSTVLFAVGTGLLPFQYSIGGFYMCEAILGAAYGIYIGVDLALVIDVLPNPDDSGKDLGVFNIANSLPQTLAPALGGILVYVGDPTGNNYLLWFLVLAGAAIIGALVIFPIKKVR